MYSLMHLSAMTASSGVRSIKAVSSAYCSSNCLPFLLVFLKWIARQSATKLKSSGASGQPW